MTNNVIISIQFIFPTVKEKKESEVTQSCPTLCDPMDCSRPWDSPGKNTGVGYHFLLQGIFLTQKLNPGLLHCRQILYQFTDSKPCGNLPNEFHAPKS